MSHVSKSDSLSPQMLALADSMKKFYYTLVTGRYMLVPQVMYN
jgi:hypothetical protein